MATVLDLIKTSLGYLGVLASGEEPEASDSADCLASLNRLLDSMNINRGSINSIQRTTYTLTLGLNPHSIGAASLTPTLTMTTGRPVKIESAGLIQSGDTIENELEIYRDHSRYAQLPDKTTTGIPTVLYYDPAFTLGKINLNPPPNAAHTLVLYTWTPLTTVLALDTTVSFPPGYERMLGYLGAVEYAPLFDTIPSALVVSQAREARSEIKRLNSPTPVLRCDDGLVGTPLRRNLQSGILN